jgi:hypothetical protein
MASPSEEKHAYPCITQQGFKPTFAEPPQDENVPAGGEGIVIGIGNLIPRWKANKADPTTLLYFVDGTGWPSEEDEKYATEAFAAAAQQWSDIAFGITFAPASDRAGANFLIKYHKAPAGSPEAGVLASAFFPNQVEDVLIYDLSLTDSFWRKHLVNTLLHEIGHIIGLRHEFALDRDENGQPREGMGAQRFGSINPKSVMSYEDVNEIRDSDVVDVKAFYELVNRSRINGVRVVDYTPRPLRL